MFSSFWRKFDGEILNQGRSHETNIHCYRCILFCRVRNDNKRPHGSGHALFQQRSVWKVRPFEQARLMVYIDAEHRKCAEVR